MQHWRGYIITLLLIFLLSVLFYGYMSPSYGGWNGGGGGSGSGGGGAIDTITADVTVGNTVTPTTLYTYTLPANVLGAAECAQQEVFGQITGNNAGTLTITAAYGAQTLTTTFTPPAITGEYLQIWWQICGDATTSAQIGELTVGYGNTRLESSKKGGFTIASTTPTAMSLSATWGTAAAGLTLTTNFAQTTTSVGVLQSSLDAHVALTTAHGSTAINTPSRIVQRDASGNFSAGTITGSLTGNVTGNALTATSASTATTAAALSANGTNCPAGQSPIGVDASGNVEGCVAWQPLDADLTTLAGKTIVGTGVNVRMSSGVFTTDDCVKVDASGNLVTSGAACGTGTGGGGGGPITINGLTGTTFTFDDVTTGSDVSWTATGSTVSLHVPDASSSARGVVTTDVQTIGGAKTFDTTVTVPGLSVNGTGQGVLSLLGPDGLHYSGFAGVNRATDWFGGIATDPGAANSALVCGVPSSTLSTCGFLTPQQAIDTFSAVSGATTGQVLTKDATGSALWKNPTASGGTVTGPGSSTDNALVRWDGTPGTVIQNSAATLADDGTLSANALIIPHTTINDTIAGIALDSTARIEWAGDTNINRIATRELQFGLDVGGVPSVYTLHGQRVANANTNGGKLQLGGGPSRGTGQGGPISLATAPASGTAGTTPNALVDHLVINSTGAINLPDLTASLGMCTDSAKNIVSCALGGTDASALATGTVPLARLVNTVTVGDAAATIVAPVVDVLITAALTAPRIYTLPLASAYPAGAHLRVTDTFGGVSATNTATLSKAGNTINGAANLVLATPNASVDLVSDGSNWDTDIQGIGRGGTGQKTAQAAIDALTAANGVADGARLTTSSNSAIWVRPTAKVSMPVVGCAGTTGTLLWNTLTATAPTPTCVAGTTNTTLLLASADFLDTGGVHVMQQEVTLPSDFNAAAGMSLTLWWRAAVATGVNVTWSAQVMCVTNATSPDAAWDTAATVTDAQVTSGQANQATINFSGASMSSCSTGPAILNIRVYRDGTTGTDTLAATASLTDAELTYSR